MALKILKEKELFREIPEINNVTFIILGRCLELSCKYCMVSNKLELEGHSLSMVKSTGSPRN